MERARASRTGSFLGLINFGITEIKNGCIFYFYLRFLPPTYVYIRLSVGERRFLRKINLAQTDQFSDNRNKKRES